VNPTIRKRRIVYGEELEDGIARGLDDIEAVALACYGRGSGLCAIETQIGNPDLSRDGVKNFKKMNSSDPIEQVAIGIIRDASEATNAYVGDGTTTTVVLACAFARAGELIDDATVSRWVGALMDNASRAPEEVKIAVETACQDGSMAKVAIDTAEATEVAIIRSDVDESRVIGGTFLSRHGGSIYEGDKNLIPLAGIWGDKMKLDALIANLVASKVKSGIIFGEGVNISGYLDQIRSKGIADFEWMPMSAKQVQDIFSKENCLPTEEIDRHVMNRHVISTDKSMVIEGVGEQLVGLVGLRGNTMAEFKERELRFDDARQTAHHAKNGTVIGAGIAYYVIANGNDALLAPWQALGGLESTKAIDTLDCVVEALKNAVTASNHLLQTKVAMVYDDNGGQL
jgi:chaperonin GroEL (HSP60 family)